MIQRYKQICTKIYSASQESGQEREPSSRQRDPAVVVGTPVHDKSSEESQIANTTQGIRIPLPTQEKI